MAFNRVSVLRRDRDVLGEAAVTFASNETGVHKSFFPTTVERVVDDHPLADARGVYAPADPHDVADDVRTLYSRKLHRISRRQPLVVAGSSSVPQAPSRVQMSVLFIPAAPTATRTSASTGSGVGTSSRYSNFSKPPWPVSRTACIA